MQTFNTIVGVLTILGQIFVVKLLIAFIFRNKLQHLWQMQWLKKLALPLAFLGSFLAVVGSLIYSNIIGFEPCVLCWWQRVFMYPLPILFFISYWRKDWTVKFYALPLAVIGAIISLYHYLIQRFQVHSVACDVLGQSPSCAGFYVFEFGYITIPLMALTVFAVVILLMLFVKKD